MRNNCLFTSVLYLGTFAAGKRESRLFQKYYDVKIGYKIIRDGNETMSFFFFLRDGISRIKMDYFELILAKV